MAGLIFNYGSKVKYWHSTVDISLALQYFLSSATNYMLEIFLLLTANLRSSNHCPAGWCLVTSRECEGLADVYVAVGVCEYNISQPRHANPTLS